MTHGPMRQKASLNLPGWKPTALALVAAAVLFWVPGAVAQSSGPGATGPVVAPEKPVVAPEKKEPKTAKTPAAPKTEKPRTQPQEEKSPKQKPSSAAAGSGSTAAEKSLDDELLGELSDGLFGPVEDELFRQGVKKSPGEKRPGKPPGDGKPSPAPQDNPEKQSPPAADEYPELNQPEGEDIGPQDNPLASISRQMQQVERLLAARRVDEQTVQMQREIVKRLEKLLQQAQRRSPRSSSGQQQPQRQQAASRPASRRDSVKLKPSSQAAAGQPKKTGAQAAQRPNPRAEKTQEKGPRTPKPKEKKRNLVQDLVKRIWGHLPPRMRQQMLQSATDRFLPQYQLEIEEYFKRVSRAQADEP